MSDQIQDRNNLTAFFKGGTILVLSNICLKAISFFLLPLYSNHLTPQMLGVSDTVTSFTGFLLPLLTFGLDSSYSAFYFSSSDERRAQKVFNTLTLVFFFLGLLPYFGFLCATDLSVLLFKTADYTPIIRIALASVSLNLWFLPFSLELRIQNRMALFGLSKIIASLLMIFLNVLFVAILKFGEYSLVLSTMLVHGIQVILLAAFVGKLPSCVCFDLPLLKQMLVFALPLVPMSLMTWILSLSDRAVILKVWGEEYVGLYGIGTRFVTLANVVISGISIAYTTFAFGNKDNKDAKKQYFFVFNVISLLLLFISFTAALFGKEILCVMHVSAAYSDSYRTIRDLMFAQTIYGMATIVGYGVFFEKKSQYSLLAVSSAALVNLSLNLLLIPKYGYAVAATTTLIGYIIQLIIIYHASVKLYPCDYGIVKISVLTLLLYFSSLFLQNASWVVKLPVWILAVTGSIYVYKALIRELLLSLSLLVAGKQRKGAL